MNIQCSYCHALHWKAESLSSSTLAHIKFGMCCYQGKISLPSLAQPPHDLHKYLISQEVIGKDFHNSIRTYNFALAMTLVGSTQIMQSTKVAVDLIPLFLKESFVMWLALYFLQRVMTLFMLSSTFTILMLLYNVACKTATINI